MRSRLLVMAPMLVFLAGCGNLQSQKRAELSPSGLTARTGEFVTLPAQLRTLSVRTGGSDYVSCAEPGPDVAMSDTFKFIAGISQDKSAEASDGVAETSSSSSRKSAINSELQTTTAALELAGRTQTVLLAREFLFRTCEAAANKWIDNAAVKENHQKIIDGVLKLIETDNTKADTAKTKAETAAAVSAVALDASVLGTTGGAVRSAILGACTTALEQCLLKPGADDKAKAACKTTFVECIK